MESTLEILHMLKKMKRKILIVYFSDFKLFFLKIFFDSGFIYSQIKNILEQNADIILYHLPKIYTLIF